MKSKHDLFGLYANPGRLQAAVLQDVEMASGGILPTGKNCISIVTEHMSRLSSGMVMDMLESTIAENPNRAVQIKDLYRHMSDPDHVGLYATPAAARPTMLVLLDELYRKGTVIGEGPAAEELFNRRKIDAGSVVTYIPANSKFNIGGYIFSNIYPIRIALTDNPTERTVLEPNVTSIAYDDTEKDLAHPLVDFHVDFRIDQDASGAGRILALSLDLLQYEMTTTVSNLLADAQYSDTYKFKDSLYQVRIFTNRDYSSETNVQERPTKKLEGVVWTELKQVIDSNVYDPSATAIPTVVVQPMISLNEVKVKIPACYFTNRRLGTRLRVELYTTKGSIQLTMPDADSRMVSAVFTTEGSDTDIATSALVQSPSITIFSPDMTIVGGGNAMTLEALKDRIVHGRTDDNVIASPGELGAFLRSKGYDYDRFKDGLTDRIYLLYRTVTDTFGNPIESGMFSTKINARDFLTKLGLTKFTYPNPGWMIPPGTLFKFDPDALVAYPLATTSIGKDSPEAVATLNSGDYITPMFHTHLFNKAGTWLAYSYDFFNPVFKKTEVVNFRSSTTAQLFLDDVSMTYVPVRRGSVVDNTLGGYVLRCYIGATAPVQSIDIALSLGGENFSLPNVLTFAAADTVIVDIKFVTNFNIDGHGKMQLSLVGASIPTSSALNITVSGTPEYRWVDMASTTDVTKPNIIAVAERDAGIALGGTADTDHCKYKTSFLFGRRVDEIFNLLEVSASAEVYKRYAEDIPAKYIEDEYAKGGDLYVANGDTVDEWIWIDAENALVRLHNVDDIIYEPIERTVEYSSALFAENGDIGTDARLIVPYDDAVHNATNMPEYPVFARSGLTADTVIDTTKPVNEHTIVEGTTISYVLPIYKHRRGNIMLDHVTKKPLLDDDGARELNFNISIPQIGLREIPGTIPDFIGNSMSGLKDAITPYRNLILGWCNEVTSMEGRLLSSTDLYFVPKATLGNMRVGSTSVPNNFVIKYTVYLKASDQMNETNMAKIREDLTKLVYANLKKPVFSQTIVGGELIKLFPSVVDSVDCLGINDDHTLQTIGNASNNTALTIANRLAISTGNSIYKFKKIDIFFKTSTTE